jgi:hypothetical protein
MLERLDYLQSLGVNAIELLPVFEFNELEYYSPIAGTDEYRCASGPGRAWQLQPAGVELPRKHPVT